MDTDQPLPSDGQLAVAARDGVAEAWAELELRHGRIATAVARKLYGRHGKSRARIGLDKLRAEVLHGTGVVVDDRNRALRAFRPRSIAAVADGAFSDPASPATDEHQAMASAFASLPEPWQAALWHHHVDVEPASGFTDVVGRTLANTDLLIERATDDLLEAFVDELRVAGVALSDSERDDRRDRVGSMLPEALVPRVAAMSVADYRTAIGAASTMAATAIASPNDTPAPAAAVDPEPIRLAETSVAEPVPPPLPPAPVVPVAIDEIPAEPTINPTREVPHVDPVVAERPTLPSTGASSLSVDEIPPAPVTPARKSGLVTALLFGVVAVALLGAAIAMIDAVRGGGNETPAAGSAVVDPDDPDNVDLSDQQNVFGMQFTVGESRADLGDDVEVSIKAPGPIFQDARGTLRLLMANKSPVDVAPTLTITPPDGITVDQVVGATCIDISPNLSAVSCDLAIPPGDTIAAEINFMVSEPAVGRFILDTNVVADPIDVAIEPVPELRYGAVGRGEVLMIGNSVLSCDDAAPACADARDGTGSIFSRRDLPAAFVGAAPAFGLANSSAATLDLGEATVSAAFLFWSGDLNMGDTIISADGPVGNITFAPPNEQPVKILDAVEVRMSESDDTHYIAYADVTELVTAAGSGSYLVGNVQSVELGGSHAGWSLVVVTNDDRKPLRELVVLSPFDRIDGLSTSQNIIPTENLRRAPTTLQVLSFDSDRGTEGDALLVNGVAMGTDDVELFGSTISGVRSPDFVDNFGTGIADYRFELNAPDSLIAVEAASADDEFHIGVITLAIDLE